MVHHAFWVSFWISFLVSFAITMNGFAVLGLLRRVRKLEEKVRILRRKI